MSTIVTNSNSGQVSPSGFSMLVQSRAFLILLRIWNCLNGFARTLRPLLNLCMLATTIAILCAVVFANQHYPSWYDETCLTDPAYYKVTKGIWKSRMEFDSLGVEPFAVKYPLLIGMMWVFAKCFGMKYALFRASMLFFGLLPIVGVFWLARKRGLIKSWTEGLQAAYFMACFGFFHWCIYIRPEAIVLSVGFLVAWCWLSGARIPLFLSSFCIPLCGLHWDVMVFPCLFAWLIWGGSFKKAILVLAGILLGTVGTLCWYHLAGMWPSYLLEAHRGGTSPSILGNISRFLYDIFLNVDFSHLFSWHYPFNAFLCTLWVFGLGAVALHFSPEASIWDRKSFVFAFLSYFALILALASAAWLNDHYPRLLAPLACLWTPLVFRHWWRKYPLLLFACAVVAACVASVVWNNIRFSREGGARTDIWMDEAALEASIDGVLSRDDVVLADASAYFAVRSRCGELFPFCYAFDLSEEQIHSCTAVLVEDNPSRLTNRDYSDGRGTSYSRAMKAFYDPDGTSGETARVTPDNLVAAVAARWDCSFEEIPFVVSTPLHRAIRYRLFRPVFADGRD